MKLYKAKKKLNTIGFYPLGESEAMGAVYGEVNKDFEVYFTSEDQEKHLIRISPEEARNLAEKLIAFAENYGK